MKIDGQLQFWRQSDPRDCSGQECKVPLLLCTVQYCNVMYSTVLYSTGQRAQVDIYFSAAHPLQERFELHEALLVLRLAQLLHQCLGLLLGELLSEVCKETEQFVSN